MSNVSSRWVDGNLEFLDKDGNVIIRFDGKNRKVTLPSGSDLDVSGAITATDLAVSVINKTGSSIGADKLVTISGLDATSGKPKIVLADTDVAAHDDVYVTTAAIANDAEGTVYKGALSAANLNTNSASAAGDPVYLGTTAGGFAHTAPTGASARVQPVGFVVVKSATVGQILWLVSPTRIIGLNEIQPASLDGTIAKVGADANVIGALPVLHRIDITAGALGDTNVVLTHKTRVVDAWLVLRGAGVATTTLQVKNGANAITDAMAASGADTAVVRVATIDDAQHEIAAGGTLRVTSATGASQPAATVYVLGVRVA